MFNWFLILVLFINFCVFWLEVWGLVIWVEYGLVKDFVCFFLCLRLIFFRNLKYFLKINIDLGIDRKGDGKRVKGVYWVLNYWLMSCKLGLLGVVGVRWVFIFIGIIDGWSLVFGFLDLFLDSEMYGRVLFLNKVLRLEILK